jgi:MFS family permease
MQRLWKGTRALDWSRELIMLAVAVFFMRFGEGLLGGARTNFFVDTLGLTSGQVLWLEGIREIPGLALMFIAALTMRLPLSRRAAVAVIIMGLGYGAFVLVQSYTALLLVAVLASLGMHMYMPLHSALGMCLATKETSGRVMGVLASVGSLAGIVGMGGVFVISSLAQEMSLRTWYMLGALVILGAAVLMLRLPKYVGYTQKKPPRMLLSPRYWLYYVLTFFEGSRKEVLGTFGTLVLVEQYGLRVWQISALLVTSAVINFVLAPRLGWLLDRYGERTMLSVSYIILALCCLAFAFVSQVWMLALVLITIKLFIVLGMGLSTYVNRIAPEEELTPTLSAGISINHVTSVAMPIVAGALLPLIGYQGIFIGTAGLIGLSVPFAMSLRVAKTTLAADEVAVADGAAMAE